MGISAVKLDGLELMIEGRSPNEVRRQAHMTTVDGLKQR
jgi:hypothetical protein